MFNFCFVPFLNKKVNGNHADITFNVSDDGVKTQIRTGKEKGREQTRLERIYIG